MSLCRELLLDLCFRNQPIPDSRPFPNYPGIASTTNGAGHQYNSHTLEGERHFRNGLSYQLSWV